MTLDTARNGRQNQNSPALAMPIPQSQATQAAKSARKFSHSMLSDVNKPEIHKLDSNGLISSLVCAAQNAANIIGKPDASVDSSTHQNLFKIPGLAVNGLFDREHGPNLPSVLTLTVDSAVSPAPRTASSSNRLDTILASNVHFELLHNSPLSTLGNGDLSLHHFDKKQPIESKRYTKYTSDKAKETIRDNLSRKLTSTSSNKVSRRNTIVSYEDAKGPEYTEDERHSIVSESSSFVDGDSSGDSDFHYASKKEREFRHIFKNISPLEKLIQTISCALLREILVQGKMYLTQNHICFNSSILGWVTNLIIPLQEVIQIEKRTTVILFPNGMAVTTLHQKYVFATVHARNATFDLVIKVWKKSLQDHKDGAKKSRIKSKTQLKPEGPRKAATEHSEWSDDEDVFSDPDELLQLLVLSQESLDDDNDNVMTRNFVKRKSRTNKMDNESDRNSHSLTFEVDVDADVFSEESEEVGKPAKSGGIFKGLWNPGPLKHAPTSFEPPKGNNSVHIMDQKFNAPLGVIFNLLFGPDISFCVNVLEAQKNFDITKDKVTGLSQAHKERSYSYIKPLSGPIGPKQTKCIITETLENYDLSNYCKVHQVTQSPDVPLGNSFKVKTSMYFAWAENNSTKMSVYTSVEWSSKSWIKGAIEKGSVDGQKQSMKAFSEAINEALSAKEPTLTGTKKKRQQASTSEAQPEAAVETQTVTATSMSTLVRLKKFLESIGLLVAFKVPMLNDMAMGVLVLFSVSLVYSLILMWAAGGRRGISIIRSGATNVIEIDGRPYDLFPSMNTYLRDPDTKQKIESQMWDWVMARTSDDVDLYSWNDNMDVGGHRQSEVAELIRLTLKRLDEVYADMK